MGMDTKMSVLPITEYEKEFFDDHFRGYLDYVVIHICDYDDISGIKAYVNRQIYILMKNYYSQTGRPSETAKRFFDYYIKTTDAIYLRAI